MDQSYYGNGKFEFVLNKSEREYLQGAHDAITICELWSWLSNYNPKNGFMFSSHTNLEKLQDEMSKNPINGCHSGSSYSATMRSMEYIAKNGYQKFKELY